MNHEELRNTLQRNCPALLDLLSAFPSSDREILLTELLDTPQPRSTAGRLDDLLKGETAATTTQILRHEDIRRILLRSIGGSGFLASLLRRNPELLKSLFLERGYLVAKDITKKESELREALTDVASVAVCDRVLRLYKEEEYLRIGSRDLGGLADVREVMAELSDLACASIRAALSFHWGVLTRKHGLPPGVDDSCGVVVLGMGKLAGRELNFSSDIDLIFLRGPEEGRTSGPEPVSVQRFYENLVRAVMKSLSQVTEDGFVFRVDLRLRPEGDKGELVPSITNSVEYYLGWGRTWERAALMKAVVVAGDFDAGKEFLDELEPFIYRKHLDYSTLDEMRLMKLQIQSQLKRKPGVNIKLGQGGIREIEFFVQALQLINAGRIRRLRTSGTLEALHRLEETDLIEPGTARDLEEAYAFFRTTEHRIQINHQMQTHELPTNPEEQEELARRMGYRDNALVRFTADLDRRRKLVGDLFDSLFYHSGDEPSSGLSPDAQIIFDTIEDRDASLEILTRLGFEDPAGSYLVLKDLLVPPEKPSGSDRTVTIRQRLVPLFVEELLKVAEPSQALVSLTAYLESLSGSAGYLSTLLENPPTVAFLMRILGESRFFTDLLIRHPQALDSLITRGAARHPKERYALESDLEERLAFCEDLEQELDVVRRFKNEEILRIGVLHLSGELESTAARWLVTELAEACLNSAVRVAHREMARKFGDTGLAGELPFVVLALGKFGGMEMTYLSDLDVIFIYDSPSPTIGRYDAHEWFTRLANRIISILSVPTSEGSVFTIDTRLRPSGNKGPLVSSLESFREYHQSSSKLWEKQALVKARAVTGPDDLVHEVHAILADCITRTGLSAEDRAEMARLRQRMQAELALEDDLHVDLKTGHGGLVDVEFFVQGTILEHAASHPAILCQNTLEALAALHREDILDEETFTVLDHGYRFLGNLEDRLRLMEHRSVNRMPLQGDKIRSLARRLGYGPDGAGALLTDYYQVTNQVRRIYGGFFDMGARSRSQR